ncbi:MAG: cysteine hydrolase [Defluviitaleaceae bacterium]|nr:cysteine hydrolase [Defluviitaleaceae bacterium]
MKVLIVVDMQKDFIDGALGTKEAAAIVPNAVKRVEEFDGEMILVTADTHGEDYLSTPEGKKLPVVHCVKGTDGWQPDTRVADAIEKKCGNKSGSRTFEKPVFGSTELVEYLKARESEISEIELFGLCTDICVVSNAIMLKNFLPGTEITVNEKCCAGVTPQSHTEAINTMKMCQINVI